MMKLPSLTLPPLEKPVRFVSLRWRWLLPMFLVLLPLAMLGAYALARSVGMGFGIAQDNILLQNSRAVNERAAALYQRQVSEARRVAFTEGVARNVARNDAAALQDTLEGLARLGGQDAMIVVDLTGREVLGVQRVEGANQTSDYAVSSGTDIQTEPLIAAALAGVADQIHNGIMRTPNGLVLFTAVPLFLPAQQQVGVVLTGLRLSTVLRELQGGALTDVALYVGDARLLATTFSDPTMLALASEVYRQTLGAVGQVITQDASLNGQSYRAAYQPLTFGENTLGVLAAYLPDDTAYVTEIGRQVAALSAAGLSAAVLTMLFVVLGNLSNRAEKISQAAQALAQGHAQTRTQMSPVDELGAAGYALDRYANYAQQQQDRLQTALQRQRRESTHLLNILEALEGGVVVQNLRGEVVLMNQHARDLLATQAQFQEHAFKELMTAVGQALGAQLAPGLYALGDPRRVHLTERVVSLQAAALQSIMNQRIGTVALLRDITDEVQRERAQTLLLDKLATEIQQPLADLARMGGVTAKGAAQADVLRVMLGEVSKHAMALQRVLVEMGELNDKVPSSPLKVRPLRLETLIWACANEWRQVAQAANLTLHVLIEQRGLYTLGDEKRLRWALGNIIDNAIKYTPAGGALTLEIKPSPDESANMVLLRVRDNGVGISTTDLPYMFMKYYRGTPIDKDGQVLHVAGMGQGLSVARNLFENHGGSVRIKSQVGVGTAVYVLLPLTAHEAMPVQTQHDLEGETMPLGMLTSVPRPTAR
jgi:two-component system, OmpR family, sensor histidine kinase ResE